MGNAANKKETLGGEVQHSVPLGLYPQCNWDLKTLRKLIAEKKLAPIFKGVEESSSANCEECPICFLYYSGGLNRSTCCKQGICTECYLQIKVPNALQVVCPFCNAQKYSVIFSGPKSKEQKEKEEEEQQKVIELQIKMRKEEEERDRQREIEKKKKQELTDKSRTESPSQSSTTTGRSSTTSSSTVSASWDEFNEHHAPHIYSSTGTHPVVSSTAPRLAVTTSQQTSRFSHSGPAAAFIPPNYQNEEELEELMLMEALRLSLLDNNPNQNSTPMPDSKSNQTHFDQLNLFEEVNLFNIMERSSDLRVESNNNVALDSEIESSESIPPLL